MSGIDAQRDVCTCIVRFLNTSDAKQTRNISIVFLMLNVLLNTIAKRYELLTGCDRYRIKFLNGFCETIGILLPNNHASNMFVPDNVFKQAIRLNGCH